MIEGQEELIMKLIEFVKSGYVTAGFVFKLEDCVKEESFNHEDVTYR